MSGSRRPERLLSKLWPTRQHLPEFIGLDEPSAIALGDELGIACAFNDADDCLHERASFQPNRLRLRLRDGKVVSGKAG